MLIGKQKINWRQCLTQWKAPLVLLLLIACLFAACLFFLLSGQHFLATTDSFDKASGLFLLLALCLACWLAWFIWRDYIEPLSQLAQLTESMLAGNLESRIQARSDSTFAPLAEDVNALGEMLLAQSNKTEKQINDHLAHITRKNNSLEVLYHVAASVNHSGDIHDLLSEHLATLMNLVNAVAGMVYLQQPKKDICPVAVKGRFSEQQQLALLHSPWFSSQDTRTLFCQQQLAKHIPEINDILGNHNKHYSLLCIPLIYRDEHLGNYTLFIDTQQSLYREDQNELLTSISQHLALAIAQYRLHKKTASLSRMKERTSIANELHDSLAQTIASIRFQARVLDDTLHQNDEKSAWQEMERLENSIDEANTELRELIAHFRVPINERGLISGVEDTIKRFRQETGIPTFFQNEWPAVKLPTDTEMQVLRIIQESLANIRKHAEANAVRVMLKGSKEHYTVLIEDDGIGTVINNNHNHEHPGKHIGLSIMQDRAKRIHGTLKIESEPGEGTRVILSFHYSNKNKIPLES